MVGVSVGGPLGTGVGETVVGTFVGGMVGEGGIDMDMDMDSERDMDINEAKISNSCGYTFEMGECKRLVSDNSDITSIQNEFWQQDTLTGSGVGLLSSNKKSSTRNFSGPRLSSTLMTCRFLRVRRVPSP